MPAMRQMLLASVPVSTALGALDQNYCTCFFKKKDQHEKHCGLLQNKEERISKPESFKGQNYLRRAEFSQVVNGMPQIKKQVEILCPTKEVIDPDT